MTQGCAGNLCDRTQPAAVIRELSVALRDVTVEFDDIRILTNECGFVT